jgi:hypothetical protein
LGDNVIAENVIKAKHFPEEVEGTRRLSTDLAISLPWDREIVKPEGESGFPTEISPVYSLILLFH